MWLGWFKKIFNVLSVICSTMTYGNYQSKLEAIRALENILQRNDHLSLSDNFITISEMNSIILDINHDNHGFVVYFWWYD